MRKPAIAICEQQRHRSACASIWVLPSRKPRRHVFSWRGSNIRITSVSNHNIYLSTYSWKIEENYHFIIFNICFPKLPYHRHHCHRQILRWQDMFSRTVRMLRHVPSTARMIQLLISCHCPLQWWHQPREASGSHALLVPWSNKQERWNYQKSKHL